MTLIQAPDPFTPSVQGRPLRWVVKHPELVLQPAQRSQYIFTVTGTGGNGEAFTLRGESFTTDDAERYTPTTFNHSRTLFQSAINLMGMLRRAPAFRDYRVRSHREDGSDEWQIFAEAGEAVDDDPVAAENELSGLTNIELTYVAGRSERRSDERLYYRVHNADGPLGPERYAPFDTEAEATIDARSEVRDLVAFGPPPDVKRLLLTWDAAAVQKITVKYGTYRRETAGADPVYGEVHESDAIPVIASLLQPWETTVLQPYGPNRAGRNDFAADGALLPWLTVRPPVRTLPRGSNAWTSIFLGEHPFYGGATRRRLRRTGRGITTFPDRPNFQFLINDTLDIDRTGVLVIGTGQNGGPSTNNHLVTHLEVWIDVDVGIDAWKQESEKLIITMGPAPPCGNTELYLLEGLGSWATIQVDEVLSRSLLTTGQNVSRPLAYNLNQGPVDAGRPFHEGGTARYLQQGSERIQVRLNYTRSRDAKLLESVAASPYGILRWADSSTGRQRYTKVLFQPDELRLHFSDNPIRPVLDLEATHEMFVR